MSDLKNIVIIGASVAGHSLANYLAPHLPTTHRILLIDANEFAYWAIGALRAAVVPGWEERVAVPLTTANVFASGTEHRVIAPNKVVELRRNSIVLEHPFEGSTEVPFFKCVIATGVLQPSPMRAELGSTLTGMQAQLRKLQSEIGQATKMVIIGGGPVGLEFAGEARERLPNASISIVHNQPRVLNPSSNPNPSNKAEGWSAPSSYPKLSTALETDLKAMNIDVILEDRVEVPVDPQAAEDWDGSFGLQAGIKNVKLRSGKVLQADYVFVSVGNKPGSGLVQKADEGAVQGGMVVVDEYLRVKSSSPGSILGDYYAIGDVCNTPGWKTSQGADADAKYAATALLADVKGTKAKKYARSVIHMLAVPLGKTRGAASMTLPLIGTFLTPKAMVGFKSKDLLVGMSFTSTFKGAEKVSVPDVKA